LTLALTACNTKKRSDVPSPQLLAVRKDIRDHLPIGSTRAAVAAYLDDRKIPHSHAGEVKEIPNDGHQEQALIRGTTKGIISSDIQIEFKFDETDSKLVSYRVSEVFTGP